MMGNGQSLSVRFAVLSLLGFAIAVVLMAMIFERHNADLLVALGTSSPAAQQFVARMEATRSEVAVMVGLPLLAIFALLFAFVRRADRLIAARNDQQVEAIAAKLQQLLEIEQRLSQELDLDRLVPLAMTETTRYMGADRSSLFLFDWKSMELSAKFAEGISQATINIPLRMGIVGTAILNRQTYNISNAYEHPYFNPELDQVLNFRTESILVAPVLDDTGRALGGIQLLNRDTGRFSADDQARAEAAAAGLAARMADLDATAARALTEELHRHIGCDRVTVFRLDASGGRLVSVYAEGVDHERIELGMNLGIAGLVAVTGQDMIVNDAQRDPRIDRQFDATTGYVTLDMMCLPVRARRGEVIGVVQVINKREGRFAQSDLEVMRSLVAVFAVFIENAMLLEDQDRQFHSLLEVMAASIDAKDRLTAGHSQRVAEIAGRIARELGFSERELDVLKVAALLHDYGKIGVDDAVLKKEGRLTAEEYEHIQHHAEMTYSILDKIFFARKYRAVPLIAGSHHEYLDGSGYPQKLTAKQIPFMSKVLTVADVFEALTADRHYRKGMTTETALAILNEGADKRFDRNVIAALERALQA